MTRKFIGGFIVVEGMDGTGKTVGQAYILNYLKQKQYPVVQGIKIKPRINSNISHIYSFFKADRNYIIPKMKEGYIVVQDRWVYSFLSHEPKDYAIDNKLQTELTLPDLLIYFISSPDKIMERLLQRLSQLTEVDKEILQNPALINQRIERYERYFASHTGLKVKLNTTNLSLEEGKKSIEAIIDAFLEKANI